MLVYILSKYRRSYSTSRLKEAIALSGHDVRVIDHTKCELQIGKNPEIFYQNSKLHKPDVILPRIGASNTFEGSNVIRQFETLGVKSTTSSNGLLNSRDKLKAIQLLSRENIPVPVTYFSSKTNSWNHITHIVGRPPFVIKLLEGTQGIGVYLVRDKNEAVDIISQYEMIDEPFLIQKYIKESKGTDVRALVIGNRVVSSMRRIAPKGEFRSNIHRGGVGEKVELTPEENQIAIKATKVLGLEVAGVDILRSKNGPLVLEVNSSPGLEGVEKYTDVDVAGHFVKYIEQL